MPVFLPKLHSQLYALTTELGVLTVPHCYVLRIKHYQRLLFQFQLFLTGTQVVNLPKDVLIIVVVVKSGHDDWSLHALIGALQSLEAILLDQASDEVLLIGWAFLLTRLSILFRIEIAFQRQEAQRLILLKQKGRAYQLGR